MHLLPSLRKSLFMRIVWARWNIALSIALNAGLWVYIYFAVPPSAIPVPLHISVYFGIDLTAPFWFYYLFPLGGIIVLILHMSLARLSFRTAPLLSFILLSGSTLLHAVMAGVVLLLTQYLP